MISSRRMMPTSKLSSQKCRYASFIIRTMTSWLSPRAVHVSFTNCAAFVALLPLAM